MQIIYIDGQCLKNYLEVDLNGKKKIKFNENFIKSYGKDIFNFQFKFQLINVEK